jgi:hypothetical protein
MSDAALNRIDLFEYLICRTTSHFIHIKGTLLGGLTWIPSGELSIPPDDALMYGLWDDGCTQLSFRSSMRVQTFKNFNWVRQHNTVTRLGKHTSLITWASRPDLNWKRTMWVIDMVPVCHPEFSVQSRNKATWGKYPRGNLKVFVLEGSWREPLKMVQCGRLPRGLFRVT